MDGWQPSLPAVRQIFPRPPLAAGLLYRLERERFEMTTCELHPAVRCGHWLEVWSRVPIKQP